MCYGGYKKQVPYTLGIMVLEHCKAMQDFQLRKSQAAGPNQVAIAGMAVSGMET